MPLQIVKSSLRRLAKDSPSKFVSGNTTNTIITTYQVNNLKQEAKREQQLERGIHPTNRMEDCLKTMSNIVQMDICSRNDRKPDGNDVLLGIVRRCTFVPSSNFVGAPSIAPDFILHD